MIYAGQPALMSPLKGAAWGRLLNHGKEVMGFGDSIETEQTDVATLLAGLASRLRNDGLALAGIACRDAEPGAVEHRDLNGLAGSLERTAALLEAVKERLCEEVPAAGRGATGDLRRGAGGRTGTEDERSTRP